MNDATPILEVPVKHRIASSVHFLIYPNIGFTGTADIKASLVDKDGNAKQFNGSAEATFERPAATSVDENRVTFDVPNILDEMNITFWERNGSKRSAHIYGRLSCQLQKDDELVISANAGDLSFISVMHVTLYQSPHSGSHLTSITSPTGTRITATIP